MATIKKYSNDSKDIASNSAKVFAQDVKDYGKAVGYKDETGIYLNYKAQDQEKYLAIYLSNEEITRYRNSLKLHNETLIEVFDCPEVSPRKIYLTADKIIFKNRKNGFEIVYSLEY